MPVVTEEKKKTKMRLLNVTEIIDHGESNFSGAMWTETKLQ